MTISTRVYTDEQAPWTQPLMAILRFFAGVLESLDQDQAKGFLVHVLNPIHRITDESGDLSAAQGESIGMHPFSLVVTDADV
jgi:U3 small nucleolar RNA-associated protein 20